MRGLGKLVMLSCILVLLTGSVFPMIKAETPLASEDFVAEEKELEAFRYELQEAGEDLFVEMQGELMRAQAQQFHNEARALQDEMQAELDALSDKLGDEILHLQLQLIIVSLSPKEEQNKLDQISKLQDQLAIGQEELEANYEKKISNLKAEHEELVREEALALQATVEQAMNEKFKDYRLGLNL